MFSTVKTIELTDASYLLMAALSGKKNQDKC